MRALSSRWKAFVGGSPLRRLGHDALVVSSTSLAARFLGFLKEVAIAAHFGLSDAVDIYLVAVVLIGFPLSILLNAVQTALVSVIAGRTETFRDVGQLLTTTILVTSACLLVLLPIWLLVLPWLFPLLVSGFAAAKQAELLFALYWLIPYYFLNAVNLLGYSALQANRRYFASGMLPLATPVITILIVVLAGAGGGWRPLVVALVAGTATETLMLLVALYRAGHIARPRIYNFPAFGAVVRHGLALIPGTFMTAVGPAAEQAIAASLGVGTNATLGYGYKLPSALMSLSVTAMGIIALPYFAEQIAQQRFEYCLHSLNRIAYGALLVGIALALPCGWFSEEIVAALYQRGAFDYDSVLRVAPVQVAYFAQIPFALVAMLGARTLSALGRNGLVSVYTVCVLAFQIALAYILGVRFDAFGIALAAAFGYAVLAALSFTSARRALKRFLR